MAIFSKLRGGKKAAAAANTQKKQQQQDQATTKQQQPLQKPMPGYVPRHMRQDSGLSTITYRDQDGITRVRSQHSFGEASGTSAGRPQSQMAAGSMQDRWASQPSSARSSFQQQRMNNSPMQHSPAAQVFVTDPEAPPLPPTTGPQSPYEQHRSSNTRSTNGYFQDPVTPYIDSAYGSGSASALHSRAPSMKNDSSPAQSFLPELDLGDMDVGAGITLPSSSGTDWRSSDGYQHKVSHQAFPMATFDFSADPDSSEIGSLKSYRKEPKRFVDPQYPTQETPTRMNSNTFTNFDRAPHTQSPAPTIIGLPKLSILAGLKVNKRGKILNEEGDPIGELVEGDIIDCVRQKANGYGEVVDDIGYVVGYVKTLPKQGMSARSATTVQGYSSFSPQPRMAWSERSSTPVQQYRYTAPEPAAVQPQSSSSYPPPAAVELPSPPEQIVPAMAHPQPARHVPSQILSKADNSTAQYVRKISHAIPRDAATVPIPIAAPAPAPAQARAREASPQKPRVSQPQVRRATSQPPSRSNNGFINESETNQPLMSPVPEDEAVRARSPPFTNSRPHAPTRIAAPENDIMSMEPRVFSERRVNSQNTPTSKPAPASDVLSLEPRVYPGRRPSPQNVLSNTPPPPSEIPAMEPRMYSAERSVSQGPPPATTLLRNDSGHFIPTAASETAGFETPLPRRASATGSLMNTNPPPMPLKLKARFSHPVIIGRSPLATQNNSPTKADEAAEDTSWNQRDMETRAPPPKAWQPVTPYSTLPPGAPYAYAQRFNHQPIGPTPQRRWDAQPERTYFTHSGKLAASQIKQAEQEEKKHAAPAPPLPNKQKSSRFSFLGGKGKRSSTIAAH